MADIPEDVMQAAKDCVDQIAHGTVPSVPGETFRQVCEEEIARAILAERDRLERAVMAALNTESSDCRKRVWSAIRSGEE